MRAESKKESPSSEGSPQKQDPLERRRLQNRLSQRNHRRKIRDRIAKLQERVIANELRAAAALRGWDQTYPSLISTCQIQSPYQEPELELSFGSEHSPQSTEPSTPFFTPYGFSPLPTDMDFSQSGGLSGNSSYYPESVCSGSMLSNQPNYSYQLMGSYYDMESFHDPWNRTLNLDNPILDDSGPIHQPHFYVATETSLPNIIRAIKLSSSQSKIIVLVPPESHSPLNGSGSLMNQIKYHGVDESPQTPLRNITTASHGP